jgi:guanylate kinase
MPRTIRIFLAPPSYQVLERRLRERERLRVSEEKLLDRLHKVESEMAHAGEYDCVVYNRDAELEAAVDDIERILRS